MSEQLYKNANPNATDNVAQAAEDAANANNADSNSDGNVYDADYKVEDDNK